MQEFKKDSLLIFSGIRVGEGERPWKRSLVPCCGLGGIVFFLFSLFFWNSWIPISREFLSTKFKRFRDYWSLDSSIAHCDCLIRLLDSLIAKIKIPSIANIKNSVDREDHKIPSIANTRIPLIGKFQNSIEREDQRVPSIADLIRPEPGRKGGAGWTWCKSTTTKNKQWPG